MSDQSYLIPSTSDLKVVETLVQVAKLIGAPNFSGSTFAEVNFHYKMESGPDKVLSKILELDGGVITHACLGIPGITVNYFRGEANATYNTALWNRLQIRGDHQGDPVKKIEATHLLLKELRPYELGRTPTSADTQTSGELIAIHSSILEKLEHTNADLVAQTTELQRQLRSDAEAIIAEERKKVEEWRDELTGNLAERDHALDARERELEEIKRSVDARSSTFARREDREKLLNEVKARVDNFGVSAATENKRRSVQTGMHMLIAVLLMLLMAAGFEIVAAHTERSRSLGAVSTLTNFAMGMDSKEVSAKLIANASEIKDNQSELPWLWLKFSLCAIGLVGSIIYYIRWQDRWANQHAMAEWQLRQFQLDISRANWVIESGLEWKKETEELMPEALADRLAHGLFIKENEPAQVLHPADELASALLGNASKLNLKTPVGDIEFNKPSKIPNTTE